MPRGQLQMLVLSVAVAVITVASFAYILVAQPEQLRSSRAGVPFFTPPVEHPESGEPIEVETLVEHFKGG